MTEPKLPPRGPHEAAPAPETEAASRASAASIGDPEVAAPGTETAKPASPNRGSGDGDGDGEGAPEESLIKEEDPDDENTKGK